MRLKHIKLVGFKSFVDPTKVPFPDQMTCVVGPNGCGKSNVIDAVRWVLGESSAKNLRGDAMSDVIFNGSSSRKPVSQASVELVFDNESGRIQGEFAAFKEISVKRQVTRDGQSNYFLNGSKCRRRDITDLFLGTGLGPRSYAIIEQGMISRLIESKPQELRVFIEEAAGISKYKERRRETENRMGHTRENLERISDVREELGQQLDKLQRQATAARRYKELKAEERRLTGELYAIRWLQLEQKRQQLQQQLSEQQTELAGWQAEQTGDERGVIERRERAQELKQWVDDKQQHVFTLSNQITRAEQKLQHQQQLQRQHQQRHQQLQQDLAEIEHQQQEDQQQQQQLSEQLEVLAPTLEQAEDQAAELEEQLHDAESRHQQFQAEQRETQQQQQQLQQQLQQQQMQQQRLQQQLAYTNEQLQQLAQQQQQPTLQQLNSELDVRQQRLDEVDHKLSSAAEQLEQKQQQRETVQRYVDEAQKHVTDVQQQLQRNSARSEALQQVLNRRQREISEATEVWLRKQHARPVREVLAVDKGWQNAIEKLIAPWLDGFWLERKPEPPLPDNIIALWPETGAVALRSTDDDVLTAADVISGPFKQWPWLTGCLLVDNIDQAEPLLGQYPDALLALSASGQWLSRHAVDNSAIDEQDSVLATQQEINQLNQANEQLQHQLTDAEQQCDQQRQQLTQSQQQIDEQQQQYQRLQTEQATCQQQLHYAGERYQALVEQQQQVEQQVTQLEQQQQQTEAQLEQVDQDVELTEQRIDEIPEYDNQQANQSEQQLRTLQQQQQQLLSQQQQIKLEQQHLERQWQQQDKLLHRHQQRRQMLQDEIEQLGVALHEAEDQALQREQLQQLLEQREEQSELLLERREQLSELEQELHELNQGSSALRDKIAQSQQQIQHSEIELAKLQERTQTVVDALAETQMNLKTLLQELPVDAAENEWEQKLEKIRTQVKRLGAINLAAIDEAETQKERKEYLDQQFDDLTSALLMLEEAIRKIDKETRQRFKTTFDAVNEDLQILFPKIFGGGSARLELTDDDLLETGVAIMAQPPGKKNSTIHLLSGGEKALTALSLVFAIFRLNPAPFCLLDEVDAPLDDTNVGRFCRLVSEMSETVQFIYISHNKVAMEMASHLAGVTMQEAGVSRLVAVDVEQAVAMTENA